MYSWAELEIHTNANVPNTVQAYAAGLAEGYITQKLISWHWQNTIGNFCAPPYSKYCKTLKSYLQENLNWVVKQIQNKAKKDPYWHQVCFARISNFKKQEILKIVYVKI